MATYTTNYQLHQWEASDSFLRTDFNTDFQKIDAAIRSAVETAQAKPEVVTGSYTGNNAEYREIDLGFSPRAIVHFYAGSVAFLVYPDHPQISGVDNKTMLAITENGFQVYRGTYRPGSYTYDYQPYTNRAGDTYRYLAVK